MILIVFGLPATGKSCFAKHTADETSHDNTIDTRR
jgi:tRNA uridine 5-carbamoylmethylation protein Kti12